MYGKRGSCRYEYPLEVVKVYPTRQQFEGSRRETYRFLIDIFKDDLDHPERRKIGNKLHYLKNLRHRADYTNPVEKHVFRRKEEVEKIINGAKEIIDLIDSL